MAESVSLNKPSICIVAHNTYGVLADVDNGHIGGVEVQTALLAKWLFANGFDVSMVTWDEGYADGCVIDGVKIYKLCRRDDGIPGLRFLYPRWFSLLKALSRANADIVYYNLGDFSLGQIVMWARQKNKKVLYTIANDVDCDKTLPALKPMRERILYRYGLVNCNAVITQTEIQKQKLLNDFSIEATVIPMPSKGFNLEDDIEIKMKRVLKSPRVLWIGRFAPEKRLEWLFDAAKQIPDVKFDVIGDANISTEYAKNLRLEANSIDNVLIHGRINHDQLARFYREAAVICSTSIYEGFPNVYLEAWSSAVPIVTSFDPDGVVSRFDLGYVVNNPVELVESLQKIQETNFWEPAARSARNYFLDYHQVDSSMQRFANEFKKLHLVNLSKEID